MELLAFCITNHFLFQKMEYFNLGGEYLFAFEFNKSESLVTIKKTRNKNYIKNFFGTQILNISAIVGNNGVGKTSLMRVLNQEPSHPVISIYYNEGKIIIRNQSKSKIIAKFDYVDYPDQKTQFSLYYSSLLDINLKSLHSPINQSNLIKDSFLDYSFDTILRQIFFLNNVGKSLSENYNELPYFDNLTIEINKISKSQFLDSKYYEESKTGKSIKLQLEMLWKHYSISSNILFNQDYDFVKNFELLILSLLVTDDTYAQTNGNGFDIGFQEVLDQNNFEDMLEVFLKKRLNNIDKRLFENLEKNFNIKIKNEKDLINRIKQDKFSKIGGFDFVKIKNHATETIVRFSRIFGLYNFITSNKSKLLNKKNKHELTLEVIKSNTFDYLKQFFALYQKVYESLQYIPFEFRLFNVTPTKKLSTGEQSLLNFYSSVYNFLLKDQNHLRGYNNYLLLLDEPEIGYHAVWKKKFIKSITDVLPELFSLLPQKPSIQIIFTTHDPLTLSDLPNNNIVYLKRIKDSKVHVFNLKSKDRPSSSFGANITDLLADSFFVEDGLIGDFAKEKINETIIWLNYKRLIKELEKQKEDIQDEKFLKLKNQEVKALKSKIKNDNMEYHKKVINIVDEPVIKAKLLEMLSIIHNDQKHLENELKHLAEKLGYDLSRKTTK